MVSSSVNKTALHPGGVQYVDLSNIFRLPAPLTNTAAHRPQVEHTELEEELHSKAHIDYDRVAIVR